MNRMKKILLSCYKFEEKSKTTCENNCIICLPSDNKDLFKMQSPSFLCVLCAHMTTTTTPI